MKHRFFYIDVLRATAIIGVMLTHSLALFLGPVAINVTWNYLHFVVVAFVFCSGYVTFHTYKNINNGKSLLTWYKNRFFRLYIPFIVYIIVYIIAYILIHRISFSSRYLFDSLTLVGGIDVGWLTLLFIQLAVLTPILVGITRNKNRFIVILTVCGLFAFITTFARIPTIYSRNLAWFPWLFIFLLGSFLAQKEQFTNIRIRYFFLTGIVSFSVWLLFTAILNHINQPLTLTIHKYPPDLYYLLYGIGINSVLLGFTKLWKSPSTLFTSIITFVSKHAYGMFFMHLIILEVLTPQNNVFTTLILSMGGTLLLTWGWTRPANKLYRP